MSDTFYYLVVQGKGWRRADERNFDTLEAALHAADTANAFRLSGEEVKVMTETKKKP